MSLATKQICRELSVDEIEEIVEQYGEAARRVREAGFDGIEFHCAHGYLLAGSFLSPLRNRRTDAYGGSVEGRLKFPLDVIRRMKARAGSDFPITIRISGDEFVPGGRTLEDTKHVAPILVEAGHQTPSTSPPEPFRRPTGEPSLPRGLLSASIGSCRPPVKQVVDVPVMVVGRINDPLVAEDILETGDADMLVIGRPLLADPELPNKAKEGRLEDINPCISCTQCLARIMSIRPLTCVINPTVGRDKEMMRSRRPQSPRRSSIAARRPRRTGGRPRGGLARPRGDPLREGHEAGRAVQPSRPSHR